MPSILFCPFCRDGFESVTECPEHGLTLVRIDRLPVPSRDTRVATHFVDPRFGRGPILVGAALTVVGFFLPFVRTESVVAAALNVAIDGAHNLWLTPVAALSLLAVLWTRRDAESMRAARLAVVGLSLGGALPVIYTTRRIAIVAEGTQTDIVWLAGVATMLAGLLVAGLGGLRLGTDRRSERS